MATRSRQSSFDEPELWIVVWCFQGKHYGEVLVCLQPEQLKVIKTDMISIVFSFNFVVKYVCNDAEE